MRGTAGSVPAAMAPASAAAAKTAGTAFPALSRLSGPTSTIRSELRPAAWATSSDTLSPSPPTTATRSWRQPEASVTASRSA